jgi:hypothetical protein
MVKSKIYNNSIINIWKRYKWLANLKYKIVDIKIYKIYIIEWPRFDNNNKFEK